MRTIKVGDWIKRSCWSSFFEVTALENGSVTLSVNGFSVSYPEDVRRWTSDIVGGWISSYGVGGWIFRDPEKAATPVLDLTKPLQTQDGRKVKIYETLSNGSIVGVIYNTPVECAPVPCVYQWDKDGKSATFPGCDLVNVPPSPPAKVTTKVYLWRSVGKNPRVFVTHSPDRRDHKLSGGGAVLIGQQEITITEGDGL